MGFLKRNWKIISADTVSTLLVILLLVLSVVIVLEFVDFVIDKEPIGVMDSIFFAGYAILLVNIIAVLRWRGEERESKIRDSESQNG